MVISSCGKYIITCDRDEKIRVSKFPNAYNIACYCLGHTDFVTNLQVVHNFSENILLSASGDGSLRVWKYLEGKEVRTKPLQPTALVQYNLQNSFYYIFQSYCLFVIGWKKKCYSRYRIEMW